MEDHVKIIEINISKEDAQKWYKCENNAGYETGIGRAIADAENEFWNEYIHGSDEFREKYKNGCMVKVNNI